MRVWIDNTGLHGAGRCLSGTARTSYDIKNFLQLATLLIFTEEVQLGSYESDAIASASREYHTELSKIGVLKETLSIQTTTEDQYRLACAAAAALAAWDMPVGYRPDVRDRRRLPVFDLPRGAEHRGLEISRIAAEQDPSAIEALARTALADKGAGAVRYMLAISPELRKQAHKVITGSRRWTQSDSFGLESYLRASLNMKLAALANATYAPAASRATLINLENKLAIEMLQDELARALPRSRPPRMQVPPVANALLQLSGGNPRALIEAALGMRERTGRLRKYLAQAARAAADGSVEGRRRLYQDIARLGRELRATLRLPESAFSPPAIDVDVALGLPMDVSAGAPIATLARLAQRLHELGRRGKVVVLTEIANRAAFSSAPRRELHRLAEASTGRKLELDDPILEIW